MLFNWIDLINVALLLAAVYAGWRIGSFSLLFVAGGFFGSFIISSWLLLHVLPVQNSAVLMIICANLSLLLTLYIAFRSFDIGQSIKRHVHAHIIGWLDGLLGVAVGLAAMVCAIWLLSAMFGRLPFVGLSNSVNNSYVVQQIDDRMPPVPALFAAYNQFIDPNSPPALSVSSSGGISSSLPTSYDDFQPVLARGAAATVRITSFGCGGLVSGSGFVVGNQLIATNAHIIAGVKRPIIKQGQKSYEAVPVYFNASLDIALLRVSGLNAPALTISNQTQNIGTNVVALGYPNGEYKIMPALISDKVNVLSSNIYGLGQVNRAAYGVQVDDEQGGSGGPLLLTNGQVAGMMFAKSTDADNFGYALKTSPISSAIKQVGNSTRRVGTGICLAD